MAPHVTDTFLFNEDVSVYGNFCGDEVDHQDRFPLNPNCESILTGIIDDTQNPPLRTLHVVTLASNNVRIDGFTIRDGHARGWYYDQFDGLHDFYGDTTLASGGGMILSSARNAQVIMCHFTNNVAGGDVLCLQGFAQSPYPGHGGAIAIFPLTSGTNAHILNCTFSENMAAGRGVSSTYTSNQIASGGAIWVSRSGGISAHITNCLFHDNAASSLDMTDPCDPEGPPIAASHARGGAIAVGITGCSPGSGGPFVDLWNNTFVNNVAHSDNSGAEVLGGGVYIGQAITASIRNSILWGNQADNEPDQLFVESACFGGTPDFDILYSNIEGSWAGTGNINVNPLFADAGNGDFRLLSTSPSIDAGTFGDGTIGFLPADAFDINKNNDTDEKTPDLDLKLRIFGCIPDMGAYEFHHPADLNGDGVVNFQDLLILLSGWGNCPGAPDPCPGDLSNDGIINFSDVLIMLGAWSDCPGADEDMGSIEDCITRVGFENVEALAACIEAMLLNETP